MPFIGLSVLASKADKADRLDRLDVMMKLESYADKVNLNRLGAR
jgi:hypothetical protein